MYLNQYVLIFIFYFYFYRNSVLVGVQEYSVRTLFMVVGTWEIIVLIK